MLLRNLSIKQGLCNGTRLVIRKLHKHTVAADIVSGKRIRNRILIHRITLSSSDNDLPFTLSSHQFPLRSHHQFNLRSHQFPPRSHQFPLRLAYSITINKSQRQTFEEVGLYLPEPVFTHGKLYVAFARTRCFDKIHLQIDQGTNQGKKKSSHYTKNIVYHQVFD